jgi:hypothetical protein
MLSKESGEIERSVKKRTPKYFKIDEKVRNPRHPNGKDKYVCALSKES